MKAGSKKIKNIKGLNNMSTMPLVHNLHQKKFFFPPFLGCYISVFTNLMESLIPCCLASSDKVVLPSTNSICRPFLIFLIFFFMLVFNPWWSGFSFIFYANSPTLNLTLGKFQNSLFKNAIPLQISLWKKTRGQRRGVDCTNLWKD